MGCIHRTDAEQGGNHGNLEGGGEFTHRLGSITVDDTPSGIDERPLALSKHVEKRRAFFLRNARGAQYLHPVFIAAKVEQAFATESAVPVLNIFRHIDHYRSR